MPKIHRVKCSRCGRPYLSVHPKTKAAVPGEGRFCPECVGKLLKRMRGTTGGT